MKILKYRLFIIASLLGLTFTPSNSQTSLTIPHQIDSLKIYRKSLELLKDSIQHSIDAIGIQIKNLEANILNEEAKQTGLSVIVTGDRCYLNNDQSKGKSPVPNGTKVTAIGLDQYDFLKVIYNNEIGFLFDFCVKPVNSELTVEMIKAKLKEIERVKRDSISRRISARNDSILSVQHAPLDAIGKTNYPFRINEIKVVDINSADGVDFIIKAQYFKKDKIIKYLNFTVVPYNAVGDIVKCNIRGVSEFTGKITGPIYSGYDDTVWKWEAAWYNNTVVCIKLLKLVVDYTDGTSYTYSSELNKIFGDFNNKCYTP